jgi:hypothetical protein
MPLAALSHLNFVLLGESLRVRFKEWLNQLATGLIKSAHQTPSPPISIPMLDGYPTCPFMVCTSQLHRREPAFESDCFQPLGNVIESFQSVPHIRRA